MNSQLLAINAALSLILFATAQAGSLRMKNGDHLAGAPSTFESDQLLWNSPSLEAPLALPYSSLHGLESAGGSFLHPGGHELMLSLTNGDLICGQLQSVDEKGVVVDTDFAGRLTVNRLMVEQAEVRPMRKEFYRGPGGDPNWKFVGPQGEWAVKGGALVCMNKSSPPGTAIRDSVLPEVCRLTIDITPTPTPPGSNAGFVLALFTADEAKRAAGMARLTVRRWGGAVDIAISSPGAQQSFVAQHPGDKDLRLELLLDSKKGVVVVCLDDKTLGVVRDLNVGQGRKLGGGIQFSSVGNSGVATPETRIPRISVSEWDGNIDEVDGAPELGEQGAEQIQQLQFGGWGGQAREAIAPKKRKPGVISLANGDEMKGQIKGIEDGKVTIETPLGVVKLPVVRLREIPVGLATKERCIRRNGDVRVGFGNGSSLVFRLKGSKDGSLLGDSQNFGEATFRIPSLRSVDFNIYEADFEQLQADSGKPD
jgi:hypothetical protein